MRVVSRTNIAAASSRAPAARRREARRDERQALGFCHARQVRGVQAARLGRELAQLLVGDADEGVVRRLLAQPAQMREERAHAGRARTARLRLHQVPR
jgi:hypothetical protein